MPVFDVAAIWTVPLPLVQLYWLYGSMSGVVSDGPDNIIECSLP